MEKRDPINPTTDDARALAQDLMRDARFGALATQGTPAPLVTRVAVLCDAGAPHLLVSDLSAHTGALLADANCSLLLGEPGGKGDPLTYPRITLIATAAQGDKTGFRATWLAAHPKSQLYYDFADFRLFRLTVTEAHLNGGFGKAFRLTAKDLHETAP